MSITRPHQGPEQQALEGPSEPMEDPAKADPVDVVYSAELAVRDGSYLLIVRDYTRGTVESTPVARKAVAKLPQYLSKLRLQPHR